MEIPAGYGVVLATAANVQEAQAIANALVEAKLAACVSLLPIHSIYTWQGKIHTEDEWQLLIKADLAQFSTLEAKIRELHSYELSEIIALPIIAGSQPYLQWIAEQIKGDS
ncbi:MULTISPECIES: divalent-cation tolerance protein CutA [Calothrix]|uniref:Divalent-cation tolerance protein CutA n=2 Tax=Calothrix TaxID=1186 RepID=A0ABR8ALH8_9CYAN|nr:MULTISPECIES: divalent-cation tolerance protein CutA [Calothrix]BAY64098.1 divalent cation tolerance protein [Calothrix brevissima NIES-22]MBD2200922.1 divalent-cation tolerance protein CutA [Calothrix parietina FACHB-288]MBD2204880.1 divalent-cation tolerance protein CutA [Calothrix sp. FACHB-168]MBD2216294.1 divalent-cation tolerance protein CutA [Calothrix sp. FACHB-1219]MBD2229944.1 divalent-cation tolerance protein CutA [Calothrix anomala FACHB-343]